MSDPVSTTPRSLRMRVCVETPLRGDIERNVVYADMCMLDCIERGEAPFLGHLLYPRVLNDEILEHCTAGISLHLTWLEAAHAIVVYSDLGVTSGMTEAIKYAERIGTPYHYRQLGHGWLERASRLACTPGFFGHRS
jgi:hypothetical protein